MGKSKKTEVVKENEFQRTEVSILFKKSDLANVKKAFFCKNINFDVEFETKIKDEEFICLKVYRQFERHDVTSFFYPMYIRFNILDAFVLKPRGERRPADGSKVFIPATHFFTFYKSDFFEIYKIFNSYGIELKVEYDAVVKDKEFICLSFHCKYNTEFLNSILHRYGLDYTNDLLLPFLI